MLGGMKADLNEYLTLDGLETRIATHRDFSAHPESVSEDVYALGGFTPQATLLDVGCGTASFLQFLRDRQHQGRLSAIDTSQRAIDAAREVADDAQVASATQLPYRDDTFDVVVARHMLYHVDNPERAIAEAQRVLRGGGTFVATVNLTGHGQSLLDVGVAALTEAGIDSSHDGTLDERVNQTNLPDMVRNVFGEAASTERPNCFQFRQPAPAVKYLASCLTLLGVAEDEAVRGRAVEAFQEAVTAQIASHQGLWEPAKGYCVVTATA